MAPLNPNATARYFIDYDTGSYSHTMMVRVLAGTTPAQLETDFNAFISPIGSLFKASVITNVRFAAAGDDNSFPVTSGQIGDTWGTGDTTPEVAPQMLTFVGRSALGRRCRFSLFAYQGLQSEFKLTGAENANLATAIAALNSATNAFRAIDGTAPNWYNYADINYNDHWVKVVRRSS